jgi:hypothetical protein
MTIDTPSSTMYNVQCFAQVKNNDVCAVAETSLTRCRNSTDTDEESVVYVREPLFLFCQRKPVLATNHLSIAHASSIASLPYNILTLTMKVCIVQLVLLFSCSRLPLAAAKTATTTTTTSLELDTVDRRTTASFSSFSSFNSFSSKRLASRRKILESSDWKQVGETIDGGFSTANGGPTFDLSKDGSMLIAGDEFYTANGMTNAGSVYIYSIDSNDNWQLDATLLGENGGDTFGISVSLSEDKNTLVVGANGIEDAGGVYIYDLTLPDWQLNPVTIDGEGLYDELGYEVALSSNGASMIVGAFSYTAYYQNLPNNEGWTHFQTFERFYSMDIAADGNRFIASGLDQRMYVFSKVGEDWQNVTLPGIDEVEVSYYGLSIAISGNGRVALVGHPLYGNFTGRAYYYQLSSDDLTWLPHGDPIDGLDRKGYFGNAVGLSHDGARMSTFIILQSILLLTHLYVHCFKQSLGQTMLEKHMSLNGVVVAFGRLGRHFKVMTPILILADAYSSPLTATASLPHGMRMFLCLMK